MKQIGYVGFDTSNYTTSAAVCSEDGEILANLRIPLPVAEGERGLRQSDAVFSHTRNLTPLCRDLSNAVAGMEIRAVGCSARPRSADDSYMPCFLAGIAAANAFASAIGVPVYEFSHQDGHIMAAAYSSGAMDALLQAPFAAFHVSGGTTEMLRVIPHADSFSVELVGGTADLHAGQAIDRVGVMMGMRFPCGRELERAASENTEKVPAPKISVKDGICHFSGLENLAAKLWAETGDRALVSAFVLEYCARTLKKMTEHVNAIDPAIPIVYAGGVMSNRYLQGVLSNRRNTYFADPAFSADNAAGIALLCRRRVLNVGGESK